MIFFYLVQIRVIYPVKPDCMQGGPRGDSCYIYRKIKSSKLTENGLKRVNSWLQKPIIWENLIVFVSLSVCLLQAFLLAHQIFFGIMY